MSAKTRIAPRNRAEAVVWRAKEEGASKEADRARQAAAEIWELALPFQSRFRKRALSLRTGRTDF